MYTPPARPVVPIPALLAEPPVNLIRPETSLTKRFGLGAAVKKPCPAPLWLPRLLSRICHPLESKSVVVPLITTPPQVLPATSPPSTVTAWTFWNTTAGVLNEVHP